jgi:BarA-like signal transduction histidine kinase
VLNLELTNSSRFLQLPDSQYDMLVVVIIVVLVVLVLVVVLVVVDVEVVEQGKLLFLNIS